MEILPLATLIILVGFMALAAFLIHQFYKGLHQVERTVNEKLDWITQRVNENLKDNSQSLRNASVELGSKVESAVRAVSDVHEHLGRMEESQRRIYEIGKDISSLQDLLRAPKIRGGIGEFFLEDLLKQMLPKGNFSMQYEFKSRERVDAIIKIGERLVPIDAKFPLENFRKFAKAQDEKEALAWKRQFTSDVKEHIKNISTKYIHPDEGTFEFALMYIPAENVYYEIIIKDEKFGEGSDSLLQYAISKKVIPVSPNSFYAYLEVILLGLKGMVVEKGARIIMQNIGRLRNELSRFCDDFIKIGRHLDNSRSSYTEAEKRLNRFGEKLHSLESPTPEEDLPKLS